MPVADLAQLAKRPDHQIAAEPTGAHLLGHVEPGGVGPVLSVRSRCAVADAEVDADPDLAHGRDYLHGADDQARSGARPLRPLQLDVDRYWGWPGIGGDEAGPVQVDLRLGGGVAPGAEKGVDVLESGGEAGVLDVVEGQPVVEVESVDSDDSR